MVVFGFALAVGGIARAAEDWDQLGYCSNLEKVTVAPDGSTFAAGWTGACSGGDLSNSSFHLVMVKLDPDGRLASEFGDRGIATLPQVVGPSFVDFELQSDGKPVVFTNTSIVRLGTDGFPDSGFGPYGNHGVVNVDLSAIDSSVESVEAAGIDTSGRMVVAGAGNPLSHPSYGLGRPSLKRFTPDGRVDTSFGSGGTEYTDLSATASDYRPASRMYDLGFSADGSILVASWLRDPSGLFNQSVGAIKYSDAGVLDTSYGHGGVALPRISFTAFEASQASMEVKPDGAIDFGVRLLEGLKGQPVGFRLGLDADGITTTGGPYVGGNYFGGAIDVSGPETYVTQTNWNSLAEERFPTFLVQGFGPSGALAGFGKSGSADIRIGPGTAAAEDLAVAPTGKLTVVGSVNGTPCSGLQGHPDSCQAMVIARLDAHTGALDPTFGTGRGIVTLPEITCPKVTVNEKEIEGIGFNAACNRQPLALKPRARLVEPRSHRPGVVLSTNLYEELPGISPSSQTVTIKLPKSLSLKKNPGRTVPRAIQRTSFTRDFDLPWTAVRSAPHFLRFSQPADPYLPLKKLQIVIPRGAVKRIAPKVVKRGLKDGFKIGVTVGYQSEYLGNQVARASLRVRARVAR